MYNNTINFKSSNIGFKASQKVVNKVTTIQKKLLSLATVATIGSGAAFASSGIVSNNTDTFESREKIEQVESPKNQNSTNPIGTSLAVSLVSLGLLIFPNKQDKNGISRLHDAIMNRDLEKVDKLLKHPNIDVNIQDNDGKTALHFALEYNDLDALTKLLNHPNLDVNIKNRWGNTALHYAAKDKNLDALTKLLNHPNTDVNIKNEDGKTALHYAVKDKNLDALTKLLNHPNLDVNIKNEDGKTALHYAVEYNDLDALTKLLNHPNLDVNIKNRWGYTALHYAAKDKKNLDALTKLLNHPNLDVNIKNHWGNTALHFATKKKNLDALTKLLNHPNTDVNIKNEEGKTALHFAVEYKNLDAFTKLSDHPNTDVNIKNRWGNTALHYAAKDKKNLDALTKLLNHPNLDVNIKNHLGETALHYALKFNDLDALTKLSDHPNTDVNIQDNDGKTALHFAVEYKNLDAFTKLLNHPNLDVNIKNRWGYTALHYALDYPVKDKNLDAFTKLLAHPNMEVTSEELESICKTFCIGLDRSYGVVSSEYHVVKAVKEYIKNYKTPAQKILKELHNEKILNSLQLDSANYYKLDIYNKVLDSKLQDDKKESLFNEKQKNGKDSLLIKLITYPMINENNNEEYKQILDKLDKLGINYNQKDKDGISVFEHIINSENTLFLKHLVKKGVKFEYNPNFDLAYNRIEDEEFNALLNSHKSDLVRFKDIDDAIESKNHSLIRTIVRKQMNSPFFDISKYV